jgi:hypothetical protein
MKPARLSLSACGPVRLFTTVGSPHPFALTLSKGAFAPHAGFDRLSPNGENAGLRYLSPNGSLRTLRFACGPQVETRLKRRVLREVHWSQ